MRRPVRRGSLSPMKKPLCVRMLLVACALPLSLQGSVLAQQGAPDAPAVRNSSLPPVSQEMLASAVRDGVPLLLAMQEPLAEGDGPKVQWAYEGVYRVQRQIPVGYRVGGSAIVALALAHAPGLAEDAPRREAIARAVGYICGEGKNHPLMSASDYDAGYDVRGWGYIEAVALLSRLKTLGAVPEGMGDVVDAALRDYVAALLAIEMPETGGWNYARPAGRDVKAAPSSFMTARALQALFEARAAGETVPADVIERGLDFLETTRTTAGSVVYSGSSTPRSDLRSGDATPGAVGRMCSVEATLLLGGRGSVIHARGAVDAFINHWQWLEARRQKTGTHVPPYGVAPYYFMFAHFYAAQCVELLPEVERGEYRRRINTLLFSVREENGSWNDRVFERSAAYGTAMAISAIMQPMLTRSGYTKVIEAPAVIEVPATP